MQCTVMCCNVLLRTPPYCMYNGRSTLVNHPDFIPSIVGDSPSKMGFVNVDLSLPLYTDLEATHIYIYIFLCVHILMQTCTQLYNKTLLTKEYPKRGQLLHVGFHAVAWSAVDAAPFFQRRWSFTGYAEVLRCDAWVAWGCLVIGCGTCCLFQVRLNKVEADLRGVTEECTRLRRCRMSTAHLWGSVGSCGMKSWWIDHCHGDLGTKNWGEQNWLGHPIHEPIFRPRKQWGEVKSHCVLWVYHPVIDGCLKCGTWDGFEYLVVDLCGFVLLLESRTLFWKT